MSEKSDQQVDLNIRLLADQVVDLGVYVEEMFKNAVSLLFTRDWSNIFTMFQTAPDITPVTLVGEAAQLLARWAPTGERLRTLIALQQAADEFGVMLGIIGRVGEKAHSLEDDVESYFPMMGPEGRQAFYRLVNSAYIQLRGCVVALSTRQASMAANVIAQDSLLDQAFLQMQAATNQALAYDVTQTLPLALLAAIVGDIEQLGNHVTRICQRIINISQGMSLDPLAFEPPAFGEVIAS